MSSYTERLVIFGGLTSNRNTVFKFIQPPGVSRDTLIKSLLDGSYRKAFLIDDQKYRTLCFALDGSAQTEMRLDDPEALTNEYTRKMMGFLLFNVRPEKILMIGLGGGSLAKYCYRHLPATQLTAVEIDPDVIAMRTHFYIPPDDERLKVINVEGADYVAKMADSGERTDVVLVDAYDEAGIARSVVKREFLQNAKRILNKNGVFVLNLVAEEEDCNRYIETIREVFASPGIVVGMKGEGNRVVFAGNALLDSSRIPQAFHNAKRVEAGLGLLFPTLLQRLNESHNDIDGSIPCC